MKLKTVLFWLLSFTWGILVTLPGAVLALSLLIAGHKPYYHAPCVRFEIEGWGCFNLGPFFFTGKFPSLHTCCHEAGHGLQNIMLGPLYPFLIAIPSAVRYHYREYQIDKGKKTEDDLPCYYSIWFENWATILGKKYYRNT